MLWDLEEAPDCEMVEHIWRQYTHAQRMDWVADVLSRLTVNQRAVLAGLSQSPEKEIRGKSFTLRLGLSSSSIQRTVGSLVLQDLVYKSDDGAYHVLNPVIRTILSEDKYFDY